MGGGGAEGGGVEGRGGESVANVWPSLSAGRQGGNHPRCPGDGSPPPARGVRERGKCHRQGEGTRVTS